MCCTSGVPRDWGWRTGARVRGIDFVGDVGLEELAVGVNGLKGCFEG